MGKGSMIRLGGLFRCCIQAVKETKVRDIEGRVIACPSCKSKLLFRRKAWEWYDEEVISGKQ
jgi:DNA-directed RNA polymerase subunit RPC12/RpoP